ncbi:MAG: hypothetical protein LBH59_01540, partial [Planctomycetaceae bacterium]|nr:hypothetical protein [Planctomycetaceae bacterium]
KRSIAKRLFKGEAYRPYRLRYNWQKFYAFKLMRQYKKITSLFRGKNNGKSTDIISEVAGFIR